jgi:putative restriction endonuclease
MFVKFDTLQIGHEYDRPFLATLWGYQSFQAISKGVVTPSETNYIILFVTKSKQIALQQYNDFIDGNLLFWEGEDKHGSDQRIVNAKRREDEIHLFYRETHHTPFIYFGKIYLSEYQQNLAKPSEFIFQIISLPKVFDIVDDINQRSTDFEEVGETEKQALIKSRIGQGSFREDLITLWGSCSLTGLKNVSLLKASHIKPWRDSINSERLDPYNGLLLTPNYDLLFDWGLIAFRENGKIIISNQLSRDDRHAFQADESQTLRKVFRRNLPFLEYHRDKILRA